MVSHDTITSVCFSMINSGYWGEFTPLVPVEICKHVIPVSFRWFRCAVEPLFACWHFSSVIINVKIGIRFSVYLWSIHCDLIASYLRVYLKVCSMAEGSRLEKQASSENSRQMLMLLTVWVSYRERGFVSETFIFSCPSSPQLFHGTSLAGLIAWFMATSPAYSPCGENKNHQQSGFLQDASLKIK